MPFNDLRHVPIVGGDEGIARNGDLVIESRHLRRPILERPQLIRSEEHLLPHLQVRGGNKKHTAYETHLMSSVHNERGCMGEGKEELTILG